MFRSARREERKDTDWIAKIRLFDGQEIATTVKNVSPSGALLTVPETMELPDRFMFRVIGRDFVCAVKMIWRRGSSVGVQIERVGKLDPKAIKPIEAPAPESAAPELANSKVTGRRGLRNSEV
jgi:hypothetical protein